MSTQQLTPEQIAALQKDPAAAAVFVDETVRSRPKGWSRRSTASYYSEEYGNHVKEIFDQMIATRKDMLIPIKRSRTVDTLYLMLHQGCKYLVENMDENGEYAKFREALVMRRRKDVGVMVEFKKADEEGLGAVVLEKKPDRAAWRERMENWIEKSKVGDKFNLEGLMLTPEDIKELKVSFHQTPSILCAVNAFSIKLLRVA